MRNLAKSTAEALIMPVERRSESYKSGDFSSKEKIKQNLVESIQYQTNNMIGKVFNKNNDKSIISNRLNNLKENWQNRSIFGNLYKIPAETIGFSYDVVDRFFLEEVPNTFIDTAQGVTSIFPYGLSIITGSKRGSLFNSRDYSTSDVTYKNSSGEKVTTTYDEDRAEQVKSGIVDLAKGLVYGNANDSNSSNEYKVSTGLFGLAKTIAVDSWSQGVTQTFQNIHDWVYATTTRSFSGLKNTVTGAIATPFYVADKILMWSGEKTLNKVKNTEFSKPNIPINFNPSNFQNARDDEGEFKTLGQRFTSVFKDKN